MWAVIGGAVLLVGVVAIVIASLTSDRDTPSPTEVPSISSTPAPPSTSSEVPGGEVVDPSAAERGWVPEPVTADPDSYIRAALAAASTFDTTRSTRDEWLAFLDTWFTPDTRYASEEDRQAVLADSRLELRQGVVLPVEEWDSLARGDGRIVAAVIDEVAFVDVPDDASGEMSIGTADIALTFTQTDESGTESEFEDEVRVSVQVLCGAGSIPTPDSAQRAGDCKVVRYFTEPLEP